MKITVLPPPPLPKRFPTAKADTAATPPVEDVSRLDLARQRKYSSGDRGARNDSEIDEAAIALVELSVLAYRDIGTVRTTIEKFPDAHLGLFGKKARRDADWQSIRMERMVRTVAEDLGAAKHQGNDAPVEWLRANIQYRRDRVKRIEPSHALAMMHGDAALIVFRGTQDSADWGLDALFAPSWSLPFRHWGFQRRWSMLRQQLQAWLDQQTQRLGLRPILYLGGHSLGGAIASLAAVDLAPSYDIARVVTIGSPRPGGTLFRKQYRDSKAAADAFGNKRKLPCVTTRFVHESDVATWVPPPPFYRHIGVKVELTAKDRLPYEEYESLVVLPTWSTARYPFAASTTRRPPDASSTTSHMPIPERGVDSSMPKFNWRYNLTQVAFYLSLQLPWGLAVILKYAPMLAEQLVRSGFHHVSERYLEFFPITEIRAPMKASHDTSTVVRA